LEPAPSGQSKGENMTDRTQDWREVADALEALALKLKLHFEQTGSDAADDVEEAGDKVRAAVRDLGDSVDRCFDGIRAAVNDPNVKQDVKDVATALRDALSNSFSDLTARRSGQH
jgi:hypothetical protein